MCTRRRGIANIPGTAALYGGPPQHYVTAVQLSLHGFGGSARPLRASEESASEERAAHVAKCFACVLLPCVHGTSLASAQSFHADSLGTMSLAVESASGMIASKGAWPSSGTDYVRAETETHGARRIMRVDCRPQCISSLLILHSPRPCMLLICPSTH